MGRDHDGSTGAILMAYLLGAISGAAIAFLWAPSTGEEARRYLNERAREGKEKATTAARESRAFAQRQRETFTTAVDRGREAYQQARERKQEGEKA